MLKDAVVALLLGLSLYMVVTRPGLLRSLGMLVIMLGTYRALRWKRMMEVRTSQQQVEGRPIMGFSDADSFLK
jgi:hypothetical protein